MFTVTFFDIADFCQIHGSFETLRSAKKAAAWLSAKKWASDVRLYRGQAGGERLQ